MIFTSAGVAVAAVTSDNGTAFLAKSTDTPVGETWTIVENIGAVFSAGNVSWVYGFTEDGNGNLYAATNAGIYRGTSDGENWVLLGNVGDVEALNQERALGQEFQVT